MADAILDCVARTVNEGLRIVSVCFAAGTAVLLADWARTPATCDRHNAPGFSKRLSHDVRRAKETKITRSNAPRAPPANGAIAENLLPGSNSESARPPARTEPKPPIAAANHGPMFPFANSFPKTPKAPPITRRTKSGPMRDGFCTVMIPVLDDDHATTATAQQPIAVAR
jgi:hypothetical protein